MKRLFDWIVNLSPNDGLFLVIVFGFVVVFFGMIISSYLAEEPFFDFFVEHVGGGAMHPRVSH